ncbi:MAG: tetratricopeptide repeat protein [Eudoraea sp.]|nr:tetratricopeptide repeat protein [Eudoraea sp.]
MKKVGLFFIVGVLGITLACRETATQKDNQQAEIAADTLSASDYAQLGRKLLYVDWEYDAAKEALLQAVELNPEDAVSHANLAWYWMLEQKKEHSLKAIIKAEKAAPDDPLWVLWHGWMCYFYDDFECAEKYLKEAIRMQPRQRDAYFVLGRMNYRNGNTEAAMEWLKKAAKDSTGRSAHAMYYIIKGQPENARIIGEAIEAQPENFEKMFLVPYYDLLGEREKALDWLERNYALRQPLLPWLRFMPILRPMHNEPRFQALVKKIGAPSMAAE